MEISTEGDFNLAQELDHTPALVTIVYALTNPPSLAPPPVHPSSSGQEPHHPHRLSPTHALIPMKQSSLRDYPAFVQAVADFIVRHGFTSMPTPGVYRRHGAEMLAHFWRRCHQHGGHDLRADVEARLGYRLADAPARPPARHLYADYPFYLERLRAHAREQGLTHVPSRKELGHGPLGVFLARHRDAHDLAADLGLPYRLGAEDIPAAYLRGDHNLRELFDQFLSANGLDHVPHEQQLYLHCHGKHLRALVAARLVDGLTWPALVERLGLTMDPDPARKRPQDYTAEEVAAEVKALCLRLGHFPRSEEFRTLGLDYLLARVRACFGKARDLAVQLGYPRRPGALVTADGRFGGTYGEWRTDQALVRLGVAYRPQAHLLPERRRCTADFAVEGPQGVIAIEVLMFDPAHPRLGVELCTRYLARFAAKAEAYRRAGIALVVVVSTRYPDDAALEDYLRRAMTSYGVRVGEPPASLPVAGPPGAAPGPWQPSPGQKPPEYWTVFAHMLREMQAIVREHGLTEIPPLSFFAAIKRHDVRAAIGQYWSRQEIGAALGLPVAPAGRVPHHHWDDPANVEAALRAYVAGRVPPSDLFPTWGELRRAKNYILINVLRKLLGEQLDALATKLGLIRRPRKP